MSIQRADRYPILLAIVAAAFACVGPSIPDDREAASIVPKLEQNFPVIEELQVGGYLIDPDCVYIGYSRGAFSSDVSQLQCWVVTYGDPKRLDPVAERDFERVRETFASTGAAVDYFAVTFDSERHVQSGSFFNVGACSYTFEPSWSSLPVADGVDMDEDAYIAGINRDWWRTC